MTEELSLDTVMARRFELVEQLAIIAARQKEETAGLTEELNLCETFVRDQMNKGNMQSTNIKGVGMAYFTTKSKCAVKDFDAVIKTALDAAAAAPAPADIPPGVLQRAIDHIYANGLWSIFTKAVSKETVKEYIGIHKTPPTGVEYSEYRDLSWKRG